MQNEAKVKTGAGGSQVHEFNGIRYHVLSSAPYRTVLQNEVNKRTL